MLVGATAKYTCSTVHNGLIRRLDFVVAPDELPRELEV